MFFRFLVLRCLLDKTSFDQTVGHVYYAFLEILKLHTEMVFYLNKQKKKQEISVLKITWSRLKFYVVSTIPRTPVEIRALFD